MKKVLPCKNFVATIKWLLLERWKGFWTYLSSGKNVEHRSRWIHEKAFFYPKDERKSSYLKRESKLWGDDKYNDPWNSLQNIFIQ